jgi:hypothetical protein
MAKLDDITFLIEQMRMWVAWFELVSQANLTLNTTLFFKTFPSIAIPEDTVKVSIAPLL